MPHRFLTLPRLSLLVVAFALFLAACSGGSTASQRGADDASNSGANGETVDSQSATNTSVSEAETTPTTEAEVADEPGLPMANGTEIEQLTAKSGAGPRPMLAWSPVADADSYTVVVYDAAGQPWWSWSGPETEVVIGGVATEAEIGGPRAAEGVRWIVMSFDAAGSFNGTSPKRSIEP